MICSSSLLIFIYAIKDMIATLNSDFPRLNRDSVERNDFCTNFTRLGVILFRSGVIGLVENKKPTCKTFDRKAAANATIATGPTSLTKYSKKALTILASPIIADSIEMVRK
jgi:hypothetical protein